MMFLIDTNVISELSRPEPNPGLLAWLSEQDELVVSVMTIQEIALGVKRRGSAKLERWFVSLLPRLVDIPVTKEIALLAAEFQVRSEKQGVVLADADGQIAATAAVAGRILVTRNIKDFVACAVTLKNPFH